MVATVDIIETVKLQTAENLNKYQDETQRWKNKKVKPREIKEGDFILRRAPKGKMKGKMNIKWKNERQDEQICQGWRPIGFKHSTGLMTRICGTKKGCKSTLYRKNVRAAGKVITEGARRNLFCIFFFFTCIKRCIKGPVLFSSRGKPCGDHHGHRRCEIFKEVGILCNPL
jgi:hypothetical protein